MKAGSSLFVAGIGILVLVVGGAFLRFFWCFLRRLQKSGLNDFSKRPLAMTFYTCFMLAVLFGGANLAWIIIKAIVPLFK